jgi:predicted transcriptional regulator
MSNLPVPATKIDQLFTLEKITPKDIEGLTQAEYQYLVKTNSEKLAGLKGQARDQFLDQIDPILHPATKTAIWEQNQSVINRAVADYMREYGVMPNKSAIAKKTGLSRQTVFKHLKEYKHHPEYTAEMEQFKYMAPNILVNVFKRALSGDMRAAKLYFDMVGATGKQAAGTVINEQNNYIQVNNTKLSQQNLEQLSAEQLNQIENIIMNKG